MFAFPRAQGDQVAALEKEFRVHRVGLGLAEGAERGGHHVRFVAPNRLAHGAADETAGKPREGDCRVARVDVIRVRVETCAVLGTDDIVEIDNLDARATQSTYERRVFACEPFVSRYGAEQEPALEF